MGSVGRDAGRGAAVTVVLSVLPGSPLAGGAVATNRRDCGYLAGLSVGALSGLLAAIPLLALFVPVFLFTNWLGLGIAPGAPGYGVFVAIVFGLFACYTVGLSALGGVLGVWIRRNTDWNLDPSRWL